MKDYDPNAADALIRSLTDVTRLLYRLATQDSASQPEAASRTAARAIADAADFRLKDVRDREPLADGEELDDVRAALAMVAGIADAVADGVIGPGQARPTLVVLMDQLATVVDLPSLEASAPAEQSDALRATASLIGELIVPEVEEPRPGERERRIPTLTVPLDPRRDGDWPILDSDLREADIPYSLTNPLPDGTALETLWIPGMRVPLQRRVVRRRDGGMMPVLTWQEHSALVAAAGEGTSYAALAALYLGCDVGLADGFADSALLSQIAEAIADARGE